MRIQFLKNGWGASVADIKIPYYVVIGGRGYWRPSKKLRAIGFKDITCGVDGPDAWETAIGWNRRASTALKGDESSPNGDMAETREQAEAARVYPVGSVGNAFQRIHPYRRMAG